MDIPWLLVLAGVGDVVAVVAGWGSGGPCASILGVQLYVATLQLLGAPCHTGAKFRFDYNFLPVPQYTHLSRV